VLVLFVTATCWRARRDGRLPPGAEAASPLAWALPYLFPGHALNPMVFSPGDVFRRRVFDPRGVLVGMLLVASKALVHTAILRCFGSAATYATLDPARLAAASRAQLWLTVAVGYLDLVVTLSGTADVAVLLARLYGWPMPSPFRFALLAWNPVELWRRWGIYNRKLLLSLVYFPLGGRRNRYRNVMLTFLASALLLHSGWFGSKYWAVGPGGWRDHTVYFLVQGLLVCGCLWIRDLRGAEDDRALRWSWPRAVGTVATQAASALVHVIILAHALPFTARFGVIARCLGLR
jgi:D-alanyl-lipoteichoic acid acyltransferase DltB (MBOAT superfamily)